MTEPPTGSESAPPDAVTHRRIPVAAAVVALVLLAVPIVVLAIVPIYARATPELFGFPFFYWFQMAMVIAAAILTFVAYLIVQAARRGAKNR